MTDKFTRPTETQESERLKYLPELIANPPLKNTSLVYSVPVMGEWKNGNVLRLLRAMLSQRSAKGEACEIEILANNGDFLNDLAAKDKDEPWLPMTDANGNVVLSDAPTDLGGRPLGSEEVKRAREALADTAEGVDFLKRVIEVQGLSLRLEKRPKDRDAAEKLARLFDQTDDPVQKDVLLLAKKASGKVAVALVDATRKSLRHTVYKGGMGGLRTLGADVALARFEDAKDAVLALFDADTVPDSTHAVKEIQAAFRRQPNLNYVFLTMQHLPAGTSKDLLVEAPGYNVGHSQYYQSFAVHHGSPQICFRLSAYKKLQEIAGWTLPGFHGDEDRDTAARLVYHFGALQDGLLFENGAMFSLFPATALTGDRLDGSFDSRNRPRGEEVRPLEQEIQEVRILRRKLHDLTQAESPERRDRIMAFLDKARQEYAKKQRLQLRFNRLVARSFVKAVQDGAIRLIDDGLRIDAAQLMAQSGGKALIHYVQNNRQLMKQIISDPHDWEVLNYLLRQTEKLSPGIKELTFFQQALREYLGDFAGAEVLDEGFLDKRGPDSRASFMHPVLAELMAIGHVYRTFFETRDFLANRKSRGTLVTDEGRTVPVWPEDPEEQRLDWHHGKQAERLGALKKRIPEALRRVPGPWYRELALPSFPVFEALKRLIGAKRDV